MLWLEFVTLGLLEIIVVDKIDCGDDEAEVDEEKNALLLWLISEDLVSTLTFDNGDNGAGYNDWVGGNSSYVNGGTLRYRDIFWIDDVKLIFECSSLWFNSCWDGNNESPFVNDVRRQQHVCDVIDIGNTS